MNIHVLNLQGAKYDLSFPEKDVTLFSIQKKLFDDYQLNTNSFYFCANSQVLPREAHLSPDFFKGEPQIIMYDSVTYPDKSYPRVDNAFNFNFSRYSDSFVQTKARAGDINHTIPEALLQQIEESGNDPFLLNVLQLLASRNNADLIMGNQPLSDSNYTSEDDTEIINEENENNRNDGNEDDLPEEDDGSQQRFEFNIYQDGNEINNAPIGRFLTRIASGNQNENNTDDEENNQTYYSDDDIPYMFAYQPPNQGEIENDDRNDTFNENEEEDGGDGNEEQLPADEPQFQFINEDGTVANADLNQLFNLAGMIRNPNIAANGNEDGEEPQEGNENRNENQRIEGLDVELTPADQAVIRRLVNAGFDQMTAIQVYIACDRNEEDAFNVLVSMG